MALSYLRAVFRKCYPKNYPILKSFGGRECKWSRVETEENILDHRGNHVFWPNGGRKAICSPVWHAVMSIGGRKVVCSPGIRVASAFQPLTGFIVPSSQTKKFTNSGEWRGSTDELSADCKRVTAVTRLRQCRLISIRGGKKSAWRGRGGSSRTEGDSLWRFGLYAL